MKNLILFSFILLLACSENSVEDVVKEDTIEEPISEINTEVTSEEDIVEDTLIEEVNNDWTKMNLVGDVQSVSIHEFQVDEDGEEIGRGGSYEQYSFNVNGMILELNMDGCCGAESEKWEYIYNEGEYLTHRKQYFDLDRDDKFEVFEQKEKYFYNSDSILVKIKFAGRDKELTKEISFDYNDDGSLKTKRVDYVIDGSFVESSFFYGPDYRTETVTGSDESMNYSITEHYGSNGLVRSEEMNFTQDTQLKKYEYKYDDRGNWIERLSYYRFDPDEDWSLSTKATRSIEYFN